MTPDVCDANRAMPQVLAFDVFGTVVDWRSSIIAESTGFLGRIGRGDIDAAAFTDAWRGQYLTAMRDYARSARAFVPLDVLHREMLDIVLRDNGIAPAACDPSLLQDWTYAWRRLQPWPDALDGLTRMRRDRPIVTLSNGNIALMLALARHGGLPWDALLGAEVTGAYKPDRHAYLGTAEILGIAPERLCLVAAHHRDLAAARACGLATAFIARPMEYGGRRAPDADAAQAWDWSATSLTDLADQMGC